MPNQDDEIIIRNDEVDEILSTPPKWILRWGITVIFILIAVGIALSYFIRYPDILTAKITLTTLNPPITLIAKNSGKLTHLFVDDKQQVAKGQTIGIIENTANYEDVFYLLKSVEEFNMKLKITDTLVYLQTKDSLRTGEITPYYLQFLKSVKDINLYKKLNQFTQQIELLRRDLQNYKSLLSKLEKQKNISDEQLKLYVSDYERDKQLVEQKIISNREFEAQKRNYLTSLSNNQQSKIMLDNANIQINSIEKNILQFQIQDYQEQARLKAELMQNVKILINEIKKWKLLYVIESPVKGKISYFNIWTTNQNINQGDELFAIIPEQKQTFIGKCTLPIQNSGKLELGQNVNVKLNNYPHSEYGILIGNVTSISQIPLKDFYVVDVKLKDGLLSTYNKKLEYKEQMTGTAEIITKKLSVMERLFFNFKILLTKSL